MPVTRCRIVANQIGRQSVQAWRAIAEAPRVALKLAGQLGMQGSEWIKRLSPSFEELGRQLENVSLYKEQVSGRMREFVFEDWAPRARVEGREGLEIIGKIIDGKLKKNQVTQRQWDLAEELRTKLFDPVMDMNAALGGTRVLADGSILAIKGSGRAFPMMPNQKGWEILADRKWDRNPRIIAMAESMVKKGRATSVDDAITQLQRRRDHLIRRTNQYVERERLADLDDDLREWNPLVVLSDWIDSQATHVAAVREWGWKLEGLESLLVKGGNETNPETYNMVRSSLMMRLGRGTEVSQSLPEEKAINAAIRSYLRYRIFAGTFLGPMRNMGQVITNTTDAPTLDVIRGLVDYPPLIADWLKQGEEVRRFALRAGGRTSEHPLQATSRRLKQSATRNFMEESTFMHSRSIGGSETRAAWIGRLALESNMERLMQIQGDRGKVAQVWGTIRSLSLNPKETMLRSLKRQGMSPERIADVLASGGRLEMADLERAAALMSHSTQFGYTLASMPIKHGQHPWIESLMMLKPFGLRQTGFIVKNILGELVQGNAKPAIKFFLATHMVGEAYNIGKDILTGSERSLTMNWLHNPDNRSAEAVGYRIMRNVADGGGLGLIQDVTWGLENYMLGPLGGTAANLKEAVQMVISTPPGAKPEMAARAAVRLMEKELVGVNQWVGVFRNIQRGIMRDHPRYFDTGQVRNRAYEWKSSQERRERLEDRGVGSFIIGEALSVLDGPNKHPPGEYTMASHAFGAAITAENTRNATEIVRQMIRAAPDEASKVEVRKRFETTIKNRSPLGVLSQADQRAFLESLSPQERTRIQRIQDEWIQDARRAVDSAFATSR